MHSETLYYILDEQGNVVPESDSEKWGKFLQHIENCIIGKQEYPFRSGTVEVSTIFLGIHHPYPFHQHKEKDDALFETMVLAEDDILSKLVDMSESDTSSIIASLIGKTDIQIRYATRDEAVKGHQQMCEFVGVCLTKLAMEGRDA